MTHIQQATANDVPTLLPLVATYWRFEGIADFEQERAAAQLTRLFTNPELGAGWIAFVDGLAVGYLLAVHVFSLEHLGLTAEIDELFVHSSQRGKGIGGKLLQNAETECVRRGCTNIALQLSRNNDSAREFYHRLGYAPRSGYELLDKRLETC
ncbi:GNAT family N-acetyltransferase [Aquipseudomonas campi]|uniref:GNAT family N-acetyltransferase n=1 Tax=Aquipseudomonas campi TaxID=2731681 RepID=A0A6M8FN29_9GAMM|nr:GNAT family N-acetyltransferase [Pseudomonas campi]QKE62058.1 GNAT family N-acetyltransferase [Pseudomonas campi]